MTDHIQSTELAQESLARFDREHWDSPVPHLDEEALDAVKSYFDDKEMAVIAASLPVGGAAEVSLGTAVSYNGHATAELVNFPDTQVGPYILGETYYPQGVAIWGLKNRQGIEPNYRNKTQ